MTKAIFGALLAVAAPVLAEAQSITVDAKHQIARVPRRLFGTNVRQNMESDAKIRDFLKETGITLFRYPDSVDSGYVWDWDAGGVMARDSKPMTSKLARFDTVIDLARDVQAEIFFTTKIHGSTPEEAARWVAEAKKRGFGGAYWCLGNEPYFPGDKFYIPREAYVDLVNRFAPAMKAADPAIRIGMAMGGPYIEEQADKGRDSFVVRGVKRHIDFVDFHFYTGRWETDKGIDPRRIMAGSQLVKTHVEKIREILRREAPEKADKIEIHYWEWNGPPWPAVGGIQTLATALHAADTLGEMVKHGVKAAIQYNLQEHACGLIPGWEQENRQDWATEHWNARTVRPVAHAIQLWSREMGSVMVKSTVEGAGTYATKDWHTLVNFQGEVPFVSAHATRSEDGRGLQLMVINRREKGDLNIKVTLEGFIPGPKVEVFSINGPSLLSNNDVTNRQPAYHSFVDAPDPVVKLERGSWTVAAAKFAYSFKAHSVTVLKMQER
jgi:alpha-L-arabinofuranosidase